VEVVATVDPRSGGVPGVAHFEDLDVALERAGADAAVVCVPTTAHAAVASVVLSAGVPALVEKPLALDPEQGRFLMRRSDELGVPLFVGHVERFNPAVRLVKAMIEKGAVGRPIAFSFRRLGLPPQAAPDVDVVHDLAVHDIDVFAMLSGHAPELVGASAWPDSGLAESAFVLLESGGVAGSVQVNWRTPVRIREFTVTTDECYVEVDYTTQNVEVVQATDVTEYHEFSEFQTHYGSARRIQMEVKPAEPLEQELRRFLAVVRGLEEPGELATAADGLRAIELASRATLRAVRG
jgi:predicted dehydrogenase